MINCTELEYCKLQVEYSGDPEIVKEKRDGIVEEFKKYKVPGFRKGKASKSAILLNFKDQIDGNLKQQMLSQAYDDIIFETNIKTIGNAQPLSASLDGDNFNCTMVLMKKPEFKLCDLESIEVPEPHVELKEEELVEKTLNDLRMNAAKVRPFENGEVIKEHDRLNVNYSIIFDSDREDIVKENEVYVVGTSSITEFDENILGASVDSELSFKVKVGDEVSEAKVKVNGAMRPDPHPLDDELAAVYGSATLKELRDNIRGSATNQIKNERDTKIQAQIEKHLIEKHNFEIPKWLYLMEAQNLAQQNGIDWSSADEETLEKFTERGKEFVKLSLVIDTVQDDFPDSVLSESEAAGILQQSLANNGINPNDYLSNPENRGRALGMLASIKKDFTMKFLVEKVKIKKEE